MPNPSRLRCSKSICSDDPFCLPVTFTPGNEIAGRVAALGEGVDGFSVGFIVFS